MKRIAFLFPGQGSQKIGMGKDFFDHYDIAKEMIECASQRIKYDFKHLLFEENDHLSQTEFTQPAILLVSSIAQVLLKEECDIKPSFALGHSLGEFSALVASGSLHYLDAVELVHQRGLLMSEACQGRNVGMMALIGLEDEKVERICLEKQKEGKLIWPANYNTDGQLVLSGIKEDLYALESVFKEEGAKKAVVLDMSVASHSPLLNTITEKIRPYLEKYLTNNFDLPVISNVSEKKYDTKEKAVDLLCQQLTQPVKYKQSILNYQDEVDLFIELGQGIVLKSLNKKITSVPTSGISDVKSLHKTLELLK